MTTIATALALLSLAVRPSPQTLRVCADPNNLPFSSRDGSGFENRLASLLARQLGDTVAYTWWAQRRGFLRNTLWAGRCDVVMGIGEGVDRTLATAPYYRSTYVFVTRRDRHLRIDSFDDPRLRTLRVGVHVIGADYNSLPPTVALARRGIVRNVSGYSIYGNYAQPSPPTRLVEAVARGEVDVAIVWGPLAGFVARHSSVPLSVRPVRNRLAAPGIPFGYDIVVAVRADSACLRDRLDRVLTRQRVQVAELLGAYGVPREPLELRHAAPRTAPCA